MLIEINDTVLPTRTLFGMDTFVGLKNQKVALVSVISQMS